MSNRRDGDTFDAKWLLIILLVLLPVLVIYQGVQEAKQAKVVEEGQAAPAFEAERLGGGEALKLTDLKGKVVLIDFWATWCPPCVKEMPTLVNLAKEYEPRGLVLIAADRIETDSREDVREFMAKMPPLPPNAHVVFATNEIAKRYNVEALPTLFIVDREGRMKSAFTGYAPESVWRERIEAVLGPK